MIRLSVLSILASLAVFALAGLCVLLSLQSQRSQYLSLSIGWQLLRVFAALQTAVQGILLVALSYWVTAFWANRYYPKLIFIAGALAVVGVVAVVRAIFKKTDVTLDVDGTLLSQEGAGRFYNELKGICHKVDTAPPDQVIVGIDDNFFAARYGRAEVIASVRFASTACGPVRSHRNAALAGERRVAAECAGRRRLVPDDRPCRGDRAEAVERL